jgi:4-hydroxy-tetrahydrodipicolinate synthase
LAKLKVEGMVGIQLTPFKSNGEVDEESYRRLVRYMLENGNRAIITMGGISESRYMTEKQKKRICEITVEEVDGEIPVIQGVMAESTYLTVKLGEDAEEVGAEGLMVPYMGVFREKSDESIFHHYYTVAKTFPKLDIMIYDATYLTPIPINVIKKLVKECGNIKYAKEQVGVTKITSLVEAFDDKIGIFCGTDIHLVPWLQLGCIGGTNSTPNVIPMHVRKIYEAGLRKDWNEVNENWFKCWPVIWSFYGQLGPRTYKHALYWLGIFDNPRYLDSFYTPREDALQYTRKALKKLGMKLVK